MQIKSILTGAAIALVAGLGSASAGERFAMLNGIQAIPLNSAELDCVTGGDITVTILNTSGTAAADFSMATGGETVSIEVGISGLNTPGGATVVGPAQDVALGPPIS